MDHDTPSGGRPGFTGFGQRLLSLVVLAVFAYLIWLALSGQYDGQVNRLAHWLKQHYQALVR